MVEHKSNKYKAIEYLFAHFIFDKPVSISTEPKNTLNHLYTSCLTHHGIHDTLNKTTNKTKARET